jgi:hypothetical protein
MSETIILTGAIRPSWPVQRNDPMVRLTDYLCAIRRWLDVPTLKQVIYCDASGCVIPEEVLGSEKFESLSFDTSDHARKYEAGRAEAETLAFVLARSRFPCDAFYKCTGRLFVKNFDALSREMEWKQNISLFLRPWYVAGWADTRFFRVRTACFKTWFEPRIPELTGKAYGGHVIESLFYEYFDQAKSFAEPRLIGHGGHGNNLYDEEYSHEEIHFAHEILRKFGRETFLTPSNESWRECRHETCSVPFPSKLCV